jgi:DNA alkylation repair enzyme
MPAIQPARLKKQASELAGKFDQPDLFIRELHTLLELYSDHTHRPGQAGEPAPLMSAYNTAPPVMREIWHERMPLIKQQPAKALPLCDALWAEPYYDMRMMAARLLGQVPLEPPEPVIERIQSWVGQGLDRLILDGLFEHSLVQLRQLEPAMLFEMISSWMASSTFSTQQSGFRAMLALINQTGVEFSPSIFRLLTPHLRIAPPNLRPDILNVLIALAHISSSETAFILRQNLSAPDNPDTAWLIRQVLDEFPEEAQIRLRTALKEVR